MDKTTATTGDLVRYTLSTSHDPAVRVELPEMGSQIAGLRILDMGQKDPLAREGRTHVEKWYQLKADHIGSYIIPGADHYQVIVGVAREAQQAFPRSPRKMVYVDWSVDDPSRVQDTPEQVRAAYEQTFQVLSSNVRDLVGAVLGVRIE